MAHPQAPWAGYSGVPHGEGGAQTPPQPFSLKGMKVSHKSVSSRPAQKDEATPLERKWELPSDYKLRNAVAGVFFTFPEIRLS